MSLNPFDKRTPEEKAADEARKAKDKAFEDAWKAEQITKKAAEKVKLEAWKAEEKKRGEEKIRTANRSCPLLVFYSELETHQYDHVKPSEQTYEVCSDFIKESCMKFDCLWWNQSSKECYILLTCKKIIGEK